ncbi:DUF192 domain-containing protein [Candidatus Saccharibacteria bacterium]|nr:DUF192 domain-containing protein [Candidatus Saccharibacteria bacterium]
MSEKQKKEKRNFWAVFWPIVFGLSVASIVALFAFQTPPTASLQTDVQTYKLDIGSTDAEQEQGLGGRDSMDTDKGMIFVFEKPAVECFWMKDMQFPLDIIWLNELKRVVHIEANVSPDTYPKQYCPSEQARYVIELNAGEAARSGIKTNQTLRL